MKRKISSSAIRKLGMAITANALVLSARSGALPGRDAATSAAGMAASSAMTSASPASSSVTGSAALITVDTGSRGSSSCRPRSPVMTPPSQSKYRSITGWSRPSSARISATICRVGVDASNGDGRITRNRLEDEERRQADDEHHRNEIGEFEPDHAQHGSAPARPVTDRGTAAPVARRCRPPLDSHHCSRYARSKYTTLSLPTRRPPTFSWAPMPHSV